MWFMRWIVVVKLFNIHVKPDESSAIRHIKSPRSLSGRSQHLTLVRMTNSIPFLQYQSVFPFIWYGYFKTNPWNYSLAKAICVVKCQSHVVGAATNRLFTSFSFHINWSCHYWDTAIYMWPWKSKVNVMAKSKSDHYIWGLVINP